MKQYPNFRLLMFLITCLVVVSGCGYTNPYSVQNDLDKRGEGVVELYLDMWDNKTDLMGFQATIQHDLILWFKKSNRFHLTQSLDKADYVLKGTIQSIYTPALTYSEFDRAATLRAEVIFSYKLNDHESGKTILKQKRLIKRESYTVGNDAVRTNSNLKKALKTMSEDLADNIYIQLFYLFTLEDRKGNRMIIPADDAKSLR